FSPVGDLALFARKAEKLFPGNDLAAEVADILNKFIDSQSNMLGATVSSVETLAALAQKQALAESRNFTRLATLIRHAAEKVRHVPGADVDLTRLLKTRVASPLAGLLTIANRLARPASVQPANPVRLGRSIETSFSAQSDIAPRLISEFKPAAAPLLYRAWTNIVKPADRLEVHALRVRAGFFASSYPGPATVTTTGGKSTTSFPSSLGIKDTWKSLVNDRTGGPPRAVALDATYDRIKPGSWVVIDRPELDPKKKTPRTLTYHRVTDVAVSGMDTGTGFTAKVTLLTLDPQWLADVKKQDDENDTNNVFQILAATRVLRDRVVYVQSEPLALAEEPLDADVSGDTIDLHEVLDGLEAGRWLIVSGQRTDVPGVSGVTASELVMLAGVSQTTNAIYGKGEISVDFGKLHTKLKFATPLGYTFDSATVTIYGNVANATNGQTVGEVLGDGDGSVAFQSMALRQAPLTFVSAPTADGAASP